MSAPVNDPPTDVIAYLSDRMLDLFAEKDPFRCEEFGVESAARALPRQDEHSCEHRQRAYRGIADQARGLDESALSPPDRLTRDIIIEQADVATRLLDFEPHTFTVNLTREFSSAAVVRGLTKAKITSGPAAHAYLARMREVPGFIDTDLAALRRGTAAARPPLRSAVQASVEELRTYLATPLSVDPLLAVPVTAFPGTSTWRAEAEAVVRDELRPAVERFVTEAEQDLLGLARDDDHAGLCWLRDGEEIYRAFLREETTLDLDPEQLHEEGQELLDAALEQIRSVGKRLLGTDDAHEIFRRLRTAPQFRYGTGEAALAAGRAAMTEIQARVPDWFGLPDPPDCAVDPMPAATAKRYPSAQYMPGTLDGSRGGRVYLNLTHPRYRDEIAGVIRGSGVPGTHMYWSYALRADIPVFQRIAYIHGFVKGWSAYGIELAAEMSPDADDLEQLALWCRRAGNATRLVVDTGLHARGWSRERAVAFQLAAGPVTRHDAETDLDRIVAMPGEGPIWVVGSRTIAEARRYAHELIGSRFTVRTFHDRLLRNGAMPLPAMRGLVDTWAAESEE